LKARGFKPRRNPVEAMPAYSLLKNSVLSVLLWKSGPSGPRKLLNINPRFSPRAAEPSFSAKLFSR
jgi:hypothetical protein